MATRSLNSNRPADKYSSILNAAIKVFARNGFFNSKVADVAREAGVADGTVYLYFKNKDDILTSIFDEKMDLVINRLSEDFSKIDDPRDKLRHLIRSHLTWLGRDRNLAIVFQVELRQSTKFMEQFSTTKVAEYFGLIRQAIEDGQRRGIFRKSFNSKLATKILFGAIDEMVTNWILSPKRYDLASTAETVIDLFFNGVVEK